MPYSFIALEDCKFKGVPSPFYSQSEPGWADVLCVVLGPGHHGKESIPSPASVYGLLSRRRSRALAVFQILFGWIITLLIVLAFFATLHFYSEEMPIMSAPTKREFNTIITGLSICLGLSLAHGLDEIISVLRWWALSRRYYSVRKVELILQAESLRNVVLLAFRTRRIRMISSAVFWLILMLVCFPAYLTAYLPARRCQQVCPSCTTWLLTTHRARNAALP